MKTAISFRNHTETGFYDYLLSRGYAESTARHYIVKLRQLDELDKLIQQPLDPFISQQETGACKDANIRGHKATSCALKRFREYQAHRGITFP